MNPSLASAIMESFADATGLTARHPPRRYLWTDAFAVCNFLGLYRHSNDAHALSLARQLVDQVHHVLGKHRPDDARAGWLSGLPEERGERHPTTGGLRIGKPLPERGATEPYDPRREWNRDGQYFHYLTKWAHALCRMASETGESCYRAWAAELMITAHRAFTVSSGQDGATRMVWKMSIDLSRPLVPSMGHHDPLDGVITALEAARDDADAGAPDGRSLTPAIRDMLAMCRHGRWATDDPLGIGGLLEALTRLIHLRARHGIECGDLLHGMAMDAEVSLRRFASHERLDGPAEERLAFRELGLAIGFYGLEAAGTMLTQSEASLLVQPLLRYRGVAARIERFWCEPGHRDNPTWAEHRDINTVMLATTVMPGGYFGA